MDRIGASKKSPGSLYNRKNEDESDKFGGKHRKTVIGNDLNLFQLGDEIGRGASGVIFKAVNVLTGDIVAAKQYEIGRDRDRANESYLSSIENEIALMQKLNHPNIVRYIDTIRPQQQTYIYIIMEFMERGSLAQVVKKFGALSEPLAAMYATQVLIGLQYLHEQGMVHRDIKGANVLTDSTGQAKLCDFGVAMDLRSGGQDADKDVVGTPYWMAPEVIEMSEPTSMSDIWAVGCLVVELVTGRPPYHNMAPMPAMFHIVQDDYPPLPPTVSELLFDFLMLCFQKEPSRRRTAEQLLLHPWLQSVRVIGQRHASPDTAAIMNPQNEAEEVSLPVESVLRSSGALNGKRSSSPARDVQFQVEMVAVELSLGSDIPDEADGSIAEHGLSTLDCEGSDFLTRPLVPSSSGSPKFGDSKRAIYPGYLHDQPISSIRSCSSISEDETGEDYSWRPQMRKLFAEKESESRGVKTTFEDSSFNSVASRSGRRRSISESKIWSERSSTLNSSATLPSQSINNLRSSTSTSGLILPPIIGLRVPSGSILEDSDAPMDSPSKPRRSTLFLSHSSLESSIMSSIMEARSNMLADDSSPFSPIEHDQASPERIAVKSESDWELEGQRLTPQRLSPIRQSPQRVEETAATITRTESIGKVKLSASAHDVSQYKELLAHIDVIKTLSHNGDILNICHQIERIVETAPEIQQSFFIANGILPLVEFFEAIEAKCCREPLAVASVLKIASCIIQDSPEIHDQLVSCCVIPIVLRIVEVLQHDFAQQMNESFKNSISTHTSNGVQAAALAPSNEMLLLSISSALADCVGFLDELISHSLLAINMILGMRDAKVFIDLMASSLQVLENLAASSPITALTSPTQCSPKIQMSGNLESLASTPPSKYQSNRTVVLESPSSPSVQTPHSGRRTAPTEQGSINQGITLQAKRTVYTCIDCIAILLTGEQRARDFGPVFIKLGLLSPLSKALTVFMASYRYASLVYRRHQKVSNSDERDTTRAVEELAGWSEADSAEKNDGSSVAKDFLSRCSQASSVVEARDSKPTKSPDNSLDCKYAHRVAMIIKLLSYGQGSVLDSLTRNENGVVPAILATLQFPELHAPLILTERSFTTNEPFDGAVSKSLSDRSRPDTFPCSDNYLAITITLLKSLMNMSINQTVISGMDKNGTIKALVPLLSGPYAERLQQSIVPCLFNLCRMNRGGQEQAVVSGIIPLLIKIVQDGSSYRPFALTMMCEFAYSTNTTRSELWRNRCVGFYTGLFSHSGYWAGHALSSLAIWLTHDPQPVEAELMSSPHINRLIGLFLTESAPSLRTVLGPLVSILEKSKGLCRQLGISGVFVRSLAKRISESTEVFLRQFYIKTLRLLHSSHVFPRQFVLDFDFYNILCKVAASSKIAQQVLVYQKVKALLEQIQSSTFS